MVLRQAATDVSHCLVAVLASLSQDAAAQEEPLVLAKLQHCQGIRAVVFRGEALLEFY